MAAPSTRVGELEIRGLSDGILKTSLDLVLGMDRAQAEQLVGGTQNGSLFIPVNNFLPQREARPFSSTPAPAIPCSRQFRSAPRWPRCIAAGALRYRKARSRAIEALGATGGPNGQAKPSFASPLR
jgi:hypothetical protein